MNHPNPIVMQVQKAKMQAATASPTGYSNGPYQNQRGPQSPGMSTSSKTETPDRNPHSPSDRASQPMSGTLRARSDESYRTPETAHSDLSRSSTFANSQNAGGYPQRQSMDGYGRPSSVASNTQAYNSNSAFVPPHNFSRPLPQGGQPAQSPQGFQPHQTFPPLTSLPPPGFATMTQAGADPQRVQSMQMENGAPQDVRMGATSDGNLMETGTPTYAMPIFGGQGIERSPFAMADDFAAWLFNEGGSFSGNPPIAYQSAGAQMPQGQVSGNPGFSLFTQDSVVPGYFQQPMPPQNQMSVTNLIDNTNMQQMALSEERRQELIEIIRTRFNDRHAPTRNKEEFLEGVEREDSSHPLSLHMLQQFIASYWMHFHPQMPILHKPTFEANKCPELLLIAIISLGASCLEKRWGFDVTQNCSELSNFLAWHLRWEIFMAKDSRPPAKLWVFQTLLLLEIFEKMYSTRPLHERAHIHHATTLTLMRRGSSLIGRSAMESPPPGSSNQSRSGSVNGGSAPYSYTPDEWWNQWIYSEATRRAAFAAFVMDSIHATMFGHSAVMVAHEMRLPLPCDEALWSATSSAEIGRVEQSLQQHGIKATTFLDGLKKTLNSQPVRTNSFGRTILMAGLLSVSWHMHQRDLQVSSLGVTQALGGRDRWRGALTRAFDFWKADLDESLSKSGETNNSTYALSRPDDENIFENRTVLHHLAHMAMHVDIVDCQIFAEANRLLGRSITPTDYNIAQRRMKEGWAPTARARDATFYALRFLSQVLMPDQHGSPHQNPAGHLVGRDPSGMYSARDDFLLNRPWVMYFATLIVWSYGYALDGPIQPMYQLESYQHVIKDMKGFLNRMGKVSGPDDLAHVTNRNACLGLLIVMRDTFAKTRWELLHEAGARLTKCIEKLAGGQNMMIPEPPA
jgi:hypothetical protein